MADRYWVGGTGTWDATTTTNWSAMSGGVGGASAPTSADNVFFNTLSNATAYTVTVTGTASCADMTMSGPATGNVTWAGSGALNVAGSMTVSSTGVTRSYTGTLTFTATTTGKTITVGVALASIITFNGAGGGWTLGAALNTSSILAITSGTLNTSAASSYALTFSSLTANSASYSGLALNASTVTVTGATFNVSGSGLTFSAGTSQINISYTLGATITTNNRTFYNLAFTGVPVAGVSNTINGSNVFNNLSFTPSATAGVLPILFGGNQTINGSLTGSGTSEILRIFYRSSVLGIARTLTLAAPTTLTNCDFRDITAATNAITATKGGDCGGNTNITGFPAPKTVYWNLAGTQNWFATAWATTSGGTPAAANFPLAQDTAIIDNAGAATTINQGANGWNVGTVDMSGRTTAVTIGMASGAPNVHGNWSNGSGVVFTGTNTMSFTGRGNVQQIFGNGVTFTQSLNVLNIGGTVRLTSALTLASTVSFTLTNGTLDLQSYTLSAGIFSSAGSVTRTIAFGTGNLTATGTSGTPFTISGTNLTVSGSRTVNVTNNTATAINVTTSSITEATALDVNILAGTYALNLGTGPGFRNLNFTGFSGSCTFQNFTQQIYGNLVLSATATYPASSGTLQFVSTVAGRTITSNGVALDIALTFNGLGGSWVLQDALTMGSTRTLTHANGTIDLNGKTLTVGASYTTTTGTKNLTFNGGTLVCPASSTTAFYNNAATGFTTTAGTGVGTISMTGATAKTFVGGVSTFNCTLNQGGAGALTITGSNTFNNIANSVQPASILFTAGTTNTFNNFSLSGTAGNLITIASATAATHTLSKASGTVSCDYLSVTNSTATGGASWYAGANSTNGGGNTGWVFSAPPVPGGNTGAFFSIL